MITQKNKACKKFPRILFSTIQKNEKAWALIYEYRYIYQYEPIHCIIWMFSFQLTLPNDINKKLLPNVLDGPKPCLTLRSQDNR